MQPSPRAETSRPLFPSLRFCIVSPAFRLESRAPKPYRSFLFIAYFSRPAVTTKTHGATVSVTLRVPMESLQRGNLDRALAGLRDGVHHDQSGARGIWLASTNSAARRAVRLHFDMP